MVEKIALVTIIKIKNLLKNPKQSIVSMLMVQQLCDIDKNERYVEKIS